MKLHTFRQLVNKTNSERLEQTLMEYGDKINYQNRIYVDCVIVSIQILMLILNELANPTANHKILSIQF